MVADVEQDFLSNYSGLKSSYA